MEDPGTGFAVMVTALVLAFAAMLASPALAGPIDDEGNRLVEPRARVVAVDSGAATAERPRSIATPHPGHAIDIAEDDAGGTGFGPVVEVSNRGMSATAWLGFSALAAMGLTAAATAALRARHRRMVAMP